MTGGEDLKNIVEAALLAAGKTLTLEQLQGLFEEPLQPERKALRAALEALNADYQGRGIEVREVASGWRIQVRKEYAPWVSRLWDEKPGRYSRALMETLALIAYRQPITRGEIEDIRGVSVSTHITKTLLEREWIRVVGHRDVPGKPALYGTTREFLDYFDLKSLDDLPPLAELRDLDEINRELNLADPDRAPEMEEQAGGAEVSESETPPVEQPADDEAQRTAGPEPDMPVADSTDEPKADRSESATRSATVIELETRSEPQPVDDAEATDDPEPEEPERTKGQETAPTDDEQRSERDG